MDFNKQLNNYKETDYSDSLPDTLAWLGKQDSNGNKDGFSIYKIAASLLILSLGVIACSLPVDQTEELGYTIKGTSIMSVSTETKELSAFMNQIRQIREENPARINYSILDKDTEHARAQIEVVMILPEATLEEAKAEEARLSSLADFTSIEILPIEGSVKRPLYAAALDKFEIVEEEVSTEEVAKGINTWIYRNQAEISGLDSIYVVEATDVPHNTFYEEREVEVAKYAFKVQVRPESTGLDSLFIIDGKRAFEYRAPETSEVIEVQSRKRQ